DRTWHIKLSPTRTLVVPERKELYRYAAFGRLKQVFFADGASTQGDPQNEGNSSAVTIFDDRGNPLKLQLVRPSLSNQYVGVQTRNVAGLVTKRRTDQSGQAMTYVESNWTYDRLGRVTQQQI